MNIKQLKSYIDRFSKSGAIKALNNMRVDLHQKIAYPFGNFVIVLVGLPFALMIRSRKGSTFMSLGLAIILGFLYYVANAVSLAFGKTESAISLFQLLSPLSFPTPTQYFENKYGLRPERRNWIIINY